MATVPDPKDPIDSFKVISVTFNQIFYEIGNTI